MAPALGRTAIKTTIPAFLLLAALEVKKRGVCFQKEPELISQQLL